MTVRAYLREQSLGVQLIKPYFPKGGLDMVVDVLGIV